ncbi:hypothetical protein HNR22_002688 [Micromonospora jinlongensis]|uniref:Uncharacterized protein n=1 Tax=Micromonospora jinlongensis TaxID=1287877 RepID=A0A7Y9X0J1_9ACTN|nr:hypothetical protein [Micromonospora jinlongensis]NYH42961.1 hypothetical protein [Micromonospora jinlongensis]
MSSPVDRAAANAVGGGYRESDGLVALGGYQPARDLDRPDTW